MSLSLGNTFANILISASLVTLSGLFSGLTLGLMSLDIVGLQILAESGGPLDRERARTYSLNILLSVVPTTGKLIPVRRHGNLLLCCLLIGNTITNALLAIFLADLTSGFQGLFLSTVLIVIFGEITPQAVCSRYRLAIGARTLLLTKIAIVLLFVVAYPISIVLDAVLGKEMGTVYNREELKTLIALQVDNPVTQPMCGLTHEDSQIMSAVLDYKDRCVRDVMTEIEKVFMLDSNTRLTFERMMEIYRSGYTRIPVYDGDRGNIIGILYSKDLILVDPDDEVEVKAVLAFHGMNHARFIPDHTRLQQVLALFKHSYSHLMVAVSRKGNGQLATGVITLEDVIEEMLNEEIIDESDRFRDNTHKQRLLHRSDRPDVAAFMKLFDHKLRKQNQLTKEETVAVCAYLKAMLPEFSEFTENVLAALVKKSEVIEIELSDDETAIRMDFDSFLPTETPRIEDPQTNIIYQQGVVNGMFSLLLQGHLEIRAGTEKFASQIGPWGFIGSYPTELSSLYESLCFVGVSALTQSGYVPDFDAVAQSSCRILQISREDYINAVQWKNVGQIVGSKLIQQNTG